MADAMEPLREDVDEEPANELVGIMMVCQRKFDERHTQLETASLRFPIYFL